MSYSCSYGSRAVLRKNNQWGCLMNQVMRRSACCLLSALLLCSCAGCANSVHKTSEGDAARSSSKTDDAAEQAYKTFTVDALDSVAADDLNNSDKLVLVNKLGAKSVHGDDAIPFAKKVDENNMYYVVSMCKQKEQAPYSLVLYKDGQPHTLTTRNPVRLMEWKQSLFRRRISLAPPHCPLSISAIRILLFPYMK